MTDQTERTDHAAAMSLDREWNPIWKQLERDVNLATAHVHDRTWIEIAYRVVKGAIDQGIVVEAAERDALRAYYDAAEAYADDPDDSANWDRLETARINVAHLFDAEGQG